MLMVCMAVGKVSMAEVDTVQGLAGYYQNYTFIADDLRPFRARIYYSLCQGLAPLAKCLHPFGVID